MDKACVIGGGSIGGIIAYYLYRSGYTRIDVYYASRKSVEAVAGNKGLTILINNREYHVPVNPLHYRSPGEECSIVFNAVKAYNVPETIGLIARITGSNSLVFMLQNGMGSCEEAAEKLGCQRVLCGVVFIGAERIKPHTVKHNGGNTIIAGSLIGINMEAQHVAYRLRKSGLDLRITGNIQLYRWIKLGVNAVINPVTALLEAPNKIITTRQGEEIAKLILDEVVEAAWRKDRIKLDKKKLLEITLRAARNTAENYSSMYQDIKHHRKTEIEYINGYITRILGEKTINNLITQLIHLKEEILKQK